MFVHSQVTSDAGVPNLLSNKTGDPSWRLVRKGIAPAFNPQNIRCALRQADVDLSSLPLNLSAS